MAMGVDARELSDDDLRQDLVHLKEKAADIDSGGTTEQQANHRTRTGELEEEFLRRNPPQAGHSPDSIADHSGPSPAPGAGTGDSPRSTEDPAPAGPNNGPVNDQPRTE